VTTQLLLIDGGRPIRHLDARTRQAGRKGLAEARRRLAALQPPVPREAARQLPRAS
jgi:hypothetical protein